MLHRLLHVNINVTDLERSVTFYEQLGFAAAVRFDFTAEDAVQTCACFGLPPTSFKGAMMKLGDDPAATSFDLIQWRNPEPRQAAPVNAIGTSRIALTTPDAAIMLARLEAMGIPLLGPPCRLTMNKAEFYEIFCFRDPDGTILEIVG